MSNFGHKDRPTVELHVEEILRPAGPPSIELISVLLERVVIVEGQPIPLVFFLRLGAIESAHRVLDEMAHADAKRTLLLRLRTIVELLDRLPWD